MGWGANTLKSWKVGQDVEKVENLDFYRFSGQKHSLSPGNKVPLISGVYCIWYYVCSYQGLSEA